MEATTMEDEIVPAAPTPPGEVLPLELVVFEDLSVPWICWPAERAPDPVIDRLHESGFSIRRFMREHQSSRVLIATFVHLADDDSVAEFVSFFGGAVQYRLLPAGPGPLFGALFVLTIGDARG
jgi:hypothetical protein